MAMQGTNAGCAAGEIRRKMKKSEPSLPWNRTSRLIWLVFLIDSPDGFSLE
jgi:hypothetical protein